jgi:leucyl aminopeptidase
LTTFETSTSSPARARADLLILPVFRGRVPGPGFAEVSEALGSDLVGLLDDHGVQGKQGETFIVPTLGAIPAGSVLVVGLGPEDEAGPTAVRRAAQKVARAASRFVTVASTLPQVGSSVQESAQAFAEGIALGAYRFDRYKSGAAENGEASGASRLETVVALVSGDRRAAGAGLRRGEIYAQSANWARDMVNMPAIDATPSFLAKEAEAMAAREGLTYRVWTKADLVKGGFGGIVGVGSGSANEPRLIELEYSNGGRSAPIAITGKGITFDSGGLSIKPAEGMEWMKADMGGAAAALAVMQAVARLRPRLNVIAAIPSAENMSGSAAIRPGDVLRHRGGRTSEVLNTDAEGRLILADSLAYLAERQPRVIIDAATLTGAAMIALGDDLYAVIGSDRGLVADLLAAGEAEGEPGWELPLWREYRRHIESTVADVKNIGIRWGGAITAGLFLKEFVGDVPWAHMDVAATAFAERPTDAWPRGATGSPARTILRYLETVAERDRAGRAPGRRAGAQVKRTTAPKRPTAAKRTTAAKGTTTAKRARGRA